jgi:hypothetical protein
MFERSVFGLVSIEPDCGITANDSGTGFIISVFDRKAYALTAAHIFSPAPLPELDQRLSYLPLAPSVGRQPSPLWRKVNALFVFDDKPAILAVTFISMSRASDVALITL